jgi:hypothetical protein
MHDATGMDLSRQYAGGNSDARVRRQASDALKRINSGAAAN